MRGSAPKRRLGPHQWLFLAVALAGVLTLASCRLIGIRQSAEPPVAGQPAPAASVKVLATGETLNVPQDLSGKPFALLFFSYG